MSKREILEYLEKETKGKFRHGVQITKTIRQITNNLPIEVQSVNASLKSMSKTQRDLFGVKVKYFRVETQRIQHGKFCRYINKERRFWIE